MPRPIPFIRDVDDDRLEMRVQYIFHLNPELHGFLQRRVIIVARLVMGVEHSDELVLLTQLDEPFEIGRLAPVPVGIQPLLLPLACRQLYADGIASDTFSRRDDRLLMSALLRP